MIDNETLKTKLNKELKQLKISKSEEDVMIKEINYLSNLLIDVYIRRVENGQK